MIILLGLSHCFSFMSLVVYGVQLYDMMGNCVCTIRVMKCFQCFELFFTAADFQT